MDVARAGEVVWYVTGRFYATADGALLDVGYFLHLQGIDAPLFSEKTMSEQTALLTFSAAPFKAPTIDNGGLRIGIDATGEFSLYLRDMPGATFDDPDTFAVGT